MQYLDLTSAALAVWGWGFSPGTMHLRLYPAQRGAATMPGTFRVPETTNAEQRQCSHSWGPSWGPSTRVGEKPG